MTSTPNPSHESFIEGIFALLNHLDSGDLRGREVIAVECNRKPWLDTGIDLVEGEAISTFSIGETHLKGTPLHFHADFQLWFRIGTDGAIFRGTRASHSFRPERSGRLYVASYFPGEWTTRAGDLAVPDEAYELVEGVLTVLLIRWAGDPLDGLRKLAGFGDVDGLLGGEIDRLTNPIETPPGWEYLWFLGPAEIYRHCHDSDRPQAICCHSRRDVGLLQKTADFPLEPGTRLHWDWRIDQLPSEVREDTLPTHDYLSIAVEFDNGQDITYFWSAELPTGHGFRCPIPSWTARETHVVIRTGPENLGSWCHEERDVYQDYAAYIEGPLPQRIVRVWLIAVSLFQGREGRCRYAGISLASDRSELKIA